MKVGDVEKKYKDEWVVAEVLKEDKLNRPIDLKVLIHGKNKKEVYKKGAKLKNYPHLMAFYTGELFMRGRIYLF